MLYDTDLRFNHFVVATADGTIFASARDSHNRIHNFLITRYGDVKRQVDSHFEPVYGDYADSIRKRAELYYARVPIYRIRSMEFN